MHRFRESGRTRQLDRPNPTGLRSAIQPDLIEIKSGWTRTTLDQAESLIAFGLG